MQSPTSLIRRLEYWLRFRRREAELREELEYHRERTQQALEHAGHPREETASMASKAMGNVTLAREDARAVWVVRWYESLWQDAAYATRSLRRQPAFALVPIAALAIAIGIAVSLFTAFKAVVLRPWPVRDLNRVVALFTQQSDGSAGFSVPEYEYLTDHATSFVGLVARWSVAARIGDETVAQVTRGYAVSGNFFNVLGIDMAQGRGFFADDDRIGAPHAIAILSYRFWQTRFGGVPGIVGTRARFNGQLFTIVGVASRTFVGLEPGHEDFWIPLSALPLLEPTDPGIVSVLTQPTLCCSVVAGRLRPGIARSQAQAEIELLSRQFRSQFGLQAWPILLSGTTFLELPNSKRQVLPLFAVMFVGVLLVLTIACANVGNLLLARAVSRRREMGVRLSLGANRARLVRQLLTESLILAVGAGAIGVALAYALPSAVLNLAAETPPFAIVPDATVLVVALILTLAACIGVGLAPALHGTHSDVAAALKDEFGMVGARRPLRGVLLTIQVAVSVCLLTAAGLCTRSVQHAEASDVDFAVSHTSIVSFNFPTAQSERTIGAGFFSDLVNRLAEAHLQPFGLCLQTPLSGISHSAMVRLPSERPDRQHLLAVEDVSPGYFDVLRIGAVAGRSFVSADADRPVALINEAMAHQYWPTDNPIGKTISVEDAPREIVGIIKEAHTARLGIVEPVVYRPFRYQPSRTQSPTFLLIRGEPSAVTAVAGVVRQITPEVRIQITPLEDQLSRALAPSRAGAVLAGLLGLFALTLATVGMWGVFGQIVQQRTREIGIRMALGATPMQVVRLILAGTSRALVLGFALGLIGAAIGSDLLKSYLYGISPLDPVAFGAVIAVLGAAAITASYAPARRASRVDPTAALRTS